MQSLPPILDFQKDARDKIVFFITGEVQFSEGGKTIKNEFTAPFYYNNKERKIKIGKVHITDPESDEYLNKRYIGR